MDHLSGLTSLLKVPVFGCKIATSLLVLTAFHGKWPPAYLVEVGDQQYIGNMTIHKNCLVKGQNGSLRNLNISKKSAKQLKLSQGERASGPN